MVGRIAEFSNADTMVFGQYARFGGQIRIDATLRDLKHDRSVPIKIDAVDEKDIPGAVDRLAASIRNNLAFSPDVINELKASSFQPVLEIGARATRLQPGCPAPARRPEPGRDYGFPVRD